MLKEIAPPLTRVGVLRDPGLAAGIGQFAAIQAMAPSSSGVELTTIDVRDPGEIERAITAFAAARNGGLIVTASQPSVIHRNLIISLALRYGLPNIYPFRYYPASGGLASYGPDPTDEHKRAAGYVDRILKGEISCGQCREAPGGAAATGLGPRVPRPVCAAGGEGKQKGRPAPGRSGRW